MRGRGGSGEGAAARVSPRMLSAAGVAPRGRAPAPGAAATAVSTGEKGYKNQVSTRVTPPWPPPSPQVPAGAGRARGLPPRPAASAPTGLPGRRVARSPPRGVNVAGGRGEGGQPGGRSHPHPLFLYLRVPYVRSGCRSGGEARGTPPWEGGNFPRRRSGAVAEGGADPARSPRCGHGGSRRGFRNSRRISGRKTKKAAGTGRTAAEPKPPALPAPSR